MRILRPAVLGVLAAGGCVSGSPAAAAQDAPAPALPIPADAPARAPHPAPPRPDAPRIPAGDESPAARPAPGDARDAWTAHGFTAAQRESLRAFFAEALAGDLAAGGAVRVEHRGEVVFEEAFGFADRKSRRPFTIDTPCRIASISKPMVATALLRAATTGEIDLDAPIDRWLPEFRGVKLPSGEAAARAPLVRELLAHTAGFPGDDSPGGRPWLAKHPEGWTLADQVRAVAARGLVRAPGIRMEYSGTGYDVAGRLLEVIAKRPFEDAMRERLFEPLGLRETSYVPADAVVARLPVYMYRWRADGRLHAAATPREIPAPGLYRSVGGGVVSTLADVARFIRFHAALAAAGDGAAAGNGETPTGGASSNDGGEPAVDANPTRGVKPRVGAGPTGGATPPDAPAAFLDPVLHARMLERRAPWPRYGLGWVLGPPRAADDPRPCWMSHTGSTGTYVWADLEHDWTGVILTQGHTVDGRPADGAAPVVPKDAPEIHREIKARLDAILGWRPQAQ